MSETAKLTRGSIRGHLVGQTLPMIFGVAAIMSVGLIDAYFIGKLGARELAAVSFIFPITIALSSLGVGVMVGINSVIARALGEGDVARAQVRAGFAAQRLHPPRGDGPDAMDAPHRHRREEGATR